MHLSHDEETSVPTNSNDRENMKNLLLLTDSIIRIAQSWVWITLRDDSLLLAWVDMDFSFYQIYVVSVKSNITKIFTTVDIQ